MKNVKYGYHYRVNEQKKVVVCIYTSNDGKWVGIARCGGSDTFDVETGKELAKKRALLAAKKQRLLWLNEIYDEAYYENLERMRICAAKVDVMKRSLSEGIRELNGEIQEYLK